MYKINIPSPGFGTFRLSGESLKHSIHTAIDAGFRHIDTAQIYKNEDEVGQAIEKSSIPRDEIFLTTKVWFDEFGREDFEQSVKDSLSWLRTDYVDLLLIHWPSPNNAVPMEEYLQCLMNCENKGYTRAVGVSNFTIPLLEKAFSIIGKDNIAVNQIEIHPHFQNKKLVNYCQANGIAVVGYMPLGKGQVMDDPVLQKIAKEHDTSPATIALAWQMQQGIIPIPASTDPEHIKSNLLAAELRLSPEQMKKIAALDTGERLIDPDFAPDW
ncbi:MAG: 2,5-didehydrogluconate reductase DkgB [Paraglaciecola sp.]|uniref:2,5-didehydrogluconate reductase DkgB n=1 Tax=Paraglaciecola sp. TaxID=1920173 RepID=UPI00273F58CA|nr:2,5-didehydrogluconate reductase DkgB [Paraglaciecola sp.]MDP5032856.1 2,5-didehydrogluconate reductase DkgB [Paraglaciecola sp.]MDP5131444.1 2,5-didehydrogluconate reductase DkgB [Paraglaciecola sp.]